MFAEQQAAAATLDHLFSVFTRSECAIRPHAFLSGPSGSGKSYLVQQAAAARKMPFLALNAAQLTQEGMSGNSLSKALRPLRKHWNTPNVIFVDEFDKLLQSNGTDTEGYRSGVQDEFLQLLESDYASVFTDYGKYEPIRISGSLFIFAGAFSNMPVRSVEDLRGLGLRTEFVGRVPLVFSTREVTMDSLCEAVWKMPLLQEYLKVFPETDAQDAGRSIIKIMREHADDNIGIRLITASIHRYFLEKA